MNKFCDKLIQLRREKGYSQEQLAEYLEVSRQSVSKWEADKTMPEISKLIAISQLFHVSLDYLLIDSCEDRGDKKWEPASETEEIRRTINEVKDYIGYQKGFEYKSRVTVAGIPLIHIKFGRYTGRIRMKDAAKGIIAVGNIAIGVVSAGFFSIGIFQHRYVISWLSGFTGDRFHRIISHGGSCYWNRGRRRNKPGYLCHRCCSCR